ncbi:peptidylprolyl isomerase [Planctomycetota bacterium]
MIKFFRKYEKILFWAILIPILATFSISYIMLQVLTSVPIPPAGVVFGEEVRQDEYEACSRRLMLRNRFRFRREQEPDDTWRWLVFVKQAERAGIRVAEAEISQRIRDIYRERKAMEVASEELGESEAYRNLDPVTRDRVYWRRVREKVDEVSFQLQDYLRMLRQTGVSAGSFEHTLAEELKIERLQSLVRNSATRDPDDLYKDYQRKHHKRQARYVAFTADSCPPSDENVTEEELTAHYDDTKADRFAEPRRVNLSYLLFPTDSFADTIAAPTEEELKARYESEKELRYRLPDLPEDKPSDGPGNGEAEPADTPGGPDADKEARPEDAGGGEPGKAEPADGAEDGEAGSEPPETPASDGADDAAGDPQPGRATNDGLSAGEKAQKGEGTEEGGTDAAPDGAGAENRPGPDAQSSDPPAPRYRPFSEVRSEIEGRIRDERTRIAARKQAEDVRSKVMEAQAEGGALDLAGLSLLHGAVYGVTGAVEMDELIRHDEIGHFSLRIMIDNQRERDVSEVLVSARGKNAFFYRVEEDRPARVIPLDDVRELVLRSFVDGHEDDLRAYFEQNAWRYREQERVELEYVKAPYTRYEKRVDEALEGDERKAKIRELASQDLAAFRDRYSEPPADGAPPPALDSLALELSLRHRTAKTEVSGKDLPDELQTADVYAHLQKAKDEVGRLSPAFQSKDESSLVTVMVNSVSPPRTPTFEEVQDTVRADLLKERAFERAKQRAGDFADRVERRSADFVTEAEGEGLSVRETGLIASNEEAEDLPGGRRFLSALFAVEELGGIGGPVHDQDEKRSVVMRFVQREKADPDGFEEKRDELLNSVATWSQQYDRLITVRELVGAEAVQRWSLETLLEAHGIGRDALKVVYELTHGAEGLWGIEARHLYVEANQETIEEVLRERASESANRVLEDLRTEKLAFDSAARKYSDDWETRRYGGRLTRFSRTDENVPAELREAAFALEKPKDIGGPVETDRGIHLIQLIDQRKQKVRIRHILFSTKRQTDPETGSLKPLPQEVLEAAMARSREVVDEAHERIQGGEPFEVVAEEVSTEAGSSDKQVYQFLTDVQLAIIRLVPKPDEGQTSGGSVVRALSFPIVVPDGAHLFLVQETSAAQEGPEQSTKKLQVRHIYRAGQGAPAALNKIREEITTAHAQAMRASTTGTDERRKLTQVFEDHARLHSQSRTALTGGRLGNFPRYPDLERWGEQFREKLYELEVGSTSEVIEGVEGWHMLHVTEHKKRTFEEGWMEIAATFLDALSF